MTDRWRATPGYELPVFATADLAREVGPVVAVDDEFRIAALGGGWAEAWRAHGANGDPFAWLTRDLRAAMQPEPRSFVEQAFRAERPISETYACGRVGMPRIFRVTCYPLAGRGAVFVHAPLDVSALCHEELIITCAYCRRWRLPGDQRRWHHGEPAREGVRISHGLCPPCRDFEFR